MTHRLIFALLALAGLAAPALGQADELRRLREENERLKVENEALKDALVKLKREAKPGDEGKAPPAAKPDPAAKELADAKASLKDLLQDMRDPAHRHRRPRNVAVGIDRGWFADWYVVSGLDIVELRRTDSAINPVIAEIAWVGETIQDGPYMSEEEAMAAKFPTAAKPTAGNNSGRKAKLAFRDGDWHLIEFHMQLGSEKYHDSTEDCKKEGDSLDWAAKPLRAALGLGLTDLERATRAFRKAQQRRNLKITPDR